MVTNGWTWSSSSPGIPPPLGVRWDFPKVSLATYVGTHGMAHGLDTVLYAARRVHKPGIGGLLVGEGARKGGP